MSMVLQVPWFSQFDKVHVERAGPTACYRACRAMAAAVGVHFPESTENRIQVATGEDERGVVICEPAVVKSALRELSDFLHERQQPVIAGLNYKRGSLNRDGVTDHFALVVGWSATPEFPDVFLALDPGRPVEAGASHNTEFALEDGRIVRSWPRGGRWLEMQVSMLVPPSQ